MDMKFTTCKGASEHLMLWIWHSEENIIHSELRSSSDHVGNTMIKIKSAQSHRDASDSKQCHDSLLVLIDVIPPQIPLCTDPLFAR